MSFSFLRRRSRGVRRAVGLDIGSHSVKMVAVSGAPGALSLTDCAIAAIETAPGNSSSAAAITRAIADAVGRKGLDLSDLRIAVSGNGAIVRHSEMPRMSPQELKSSIRYEAEVLLPFSLDDCIFDCQILDPDNKGSPRMKVVLAAARKAVVQERLNLIKDLGSVPKTISIDSIALANAFEFAMGGLPALGDAVRQPPPGPAADIQKDPAPQQASPAPPADSRQDSAPPQASPGSPTDSRQDTGLHAPDNAQGLPQNPAPGQASPDGSRETAEKGSDGTVLLVHVGAVRTILNVMSASGLEFTRDIEVGGNNATRAIARGLGIEFQEAERRKQAGDAAAKEFISSLVMILSRELRSTCSYVSSKMNKHVGTIYLSGGGALWEGMREVLAADLGIEISLWNPLRGISPGTGAASGDPASRGAVLAVAAGLAVADIGAA